jgi:fimbrial chaperone protein
MKNFPAKALLVLVASSLAVPISAGPFSVTPVRIFMNPKDKAVAVTITNEGDDELVMQADVFTWKQKPDGEDDLTLTEDLLLSPPIIKLAGKSRQVVRLARLRPLQQADQLTYRMIVREIPNAKQSKDNLQLQIALAFSLPVFITPPKAKYVLGCVTERMAPDTVRAVCENTGNAYTQLLDFALTGPKGNKLAGLDRGGYILPTIKRNFDIRSEDNKPIPGGEAKLTVRLDDGSKHTFDVVLTE